MLSAEQMRSLPDVFRTITDPRSRYDRERPRTGWCRSRHGCP